MDICVAKDSPASKYMPKSALRLLRAQLNCGCADLPMWFSFTV